jgi:hypothetical protein
MPCRISESLPQRKLGQRSPMPWMRTVSACTDFGGVGETTFGDLSPTRVDDIVYASQEEHAPGWY